MRHHKVTHAARFGLVARGVLYALLGLLSFQIAGGGSGREADTQGALNSVAAGPFGTVLLAVLALGFAVYAGWQAWCAWDGDETRSRLAAAFRSLLWAGFAFIAARTIVGSGGGGGGEESLTARILGAPFGTWLVALAGIVTIGVGLSFLRHLRGRSYLEDLRPLQGTTRRAVSVTATVGIAARTVVTVLVGAFLIRAAVNHEPNSGIGLDGALSQVSRQPYGTYVLVTCALGLVAYALWCAMRARYEDVQRSDG